MLNCRRLPQWQKELSVREKDSTQQMNQEERERERERISERERERGSHLVFVSGLHLQFVLGNLGLTLVPQFLDGGLQSGVQEVTEVHTLYGRLLQLGVETGQLLQEGGDILASLVHGTLLLHRVRVYTLDYSCADSIKKHYSANPRRIAHARYR